MRRLARRLFTLCSGASVVLFVAVCVLWVWSYRALLDLSLAGNACQLRSAAGEFTVVYWDRPAPYIPDAGDVDEFRQLGRVHWRRLGVVFAHYDDYHANPRAVIGVQYPVLVLLTLLLPGACFGIAYMGRRRRTRAERGLCPACGYDLRATPGRCPECGAAAAALQA